MAKIKDVKQQIKFELKKAGVDSPAFDTLCLIEKVLKCSREQLIAMSEDDFDKARLPELESLVSRRISGEPLQYIIGQWEFAGYPFKVGAGVLIPRDDTEVVLADCLNFLKAKGKCEVLDLCSGSGALAVAISKKTNLHVTAVEKSDEALPYLHENIKINNADVSVFQGDVFSCAESFFDDSFDLIVSNPPYVKSNDIKNLQREISYEPSVALDGGEDGLVFYRHIIKHWSKKLKAGGMLAFEIGEGQYGDIEKILRQYGFENIGGSLDLGGIQRTINGTLSAK